MSSESVLSEFSLIDALHAHMRVVRPDVIVASGDDASIVAPPTGHRLAISTDTLVAGVHFPPDTPPHAIGYKALAVNISDISAMGAEPAWVSLSLALPDNDKAFIDGFASGFASLACEYGVQLIGGDTTYSSVLTVTVNIIGLIPDDVPPLTRAGAQVGDDIYVSGELGGAGHELDNLMGFAPTERVALNYPTPNVALGLALRGVASSCIDVSDGVLGDIAHILQASSAPYSQANAKLLGATIALDKLPLHPHIQGYAHTDRAWAFALCAGDEYQLCFTAPEAVRERVDELARLYPVTRIGKIVASKSNAILLFNGVEAVDVARLARHIQPYEHF